MGPFYRTTTSQAKQQDPADLEVRILSPRSSLTGPSVLHTPTARRRGRNNSRRVYEWLLVGILALSLLAFFGSVNIRMALLRRSEPLERKPLDVVTVSLKPSCVTRQAVASLNRYLQPRSIHVVTTSSEKCAVFTSFAPNVVCHTQDTFLEGLTVERVGEFLERSLGLDQHKHFKGRELSGWYMQQFLKLGSVLALPNLSDYYLIWDLDMILLSPVQLLWRAPDDIAGGGRDSAADAVGGGSEHIQTLVNIGGSISPGYVSSFQRLTKRKLEFAPDGSSFVTHWMVIYKPYLLEFLSDLGGGGDGSLDWVWRVLGAIDPRTADLGFSEYASYVSWVRQHYPQSQRLAPRKTWVRHPFGQSTVKLLRLLRADRCCCPNGLLLRLLRVLGFVYTGYEVGHIAECRYATAEHAASYGL